MNKVYIVTWECVHNYYTDDHSGLNIYGVFATKEDAAKAKDNLINQMIEDSKKDGIKYKMVSNNDDYADVEIDEEEYYFYITDYQIGKVYVD